MSILKLKRKLNKLVVKKGKSFGKGKFYQSYEPLEIIGQRSTEERFHQYGIKKILKPNFEVLDIGCNCGFFSIYVARHVKTVHGIEPNKALCEAGRLVCDYINASHVKFFDEAWTSFKSPIKYDLILSLAAHKWVKVPLEQYITKIKSMLKPQGYLFIESHHKGLYDKDWNKKVKLIESKGFTQLWSGDSSEEGRPREFIMFRFT